METSIDEQLAEKPENPVSASNGGKSDDDLLRMLKGWHRESVDWEKGWRPKAYQAQRVYHSHQWETDEKQGLESQGRIPFVSNHAQKIINSIIGFRLENKQEIEVLPRGDGDIEIADLRTQIIAYLLDANLSEFVTSDVVTQQTIGPCAWQFIGYQDDDPRKERIADRYVPWVQMRLDSQAMRNGIFNTDEHRYTMREKWATVDEAKRLHPSKADEIARYATTRSLAGDNDTITADHADDEYRHHNADGGYYCAQTQEVRLVEAWYREKRSGHYLTTLDGHTVPFDPKDQGHHLQEMMGAKVVPGVINDVFFATFLGDVLLEHGESPYPYAKFPYQPTWGYIDHNGHPYGALMVLLDPQKLINWGKSKLQWLGASNQIKVMGDGVDDEEVRQNAARPDGVFHIPVGGEIEFVDRSEMIAVTSQIVQDATNDMRELGGSGDELRGQQSNATAGVAIQARIESSIRQHARLFDQEKRTMTVKGQMFNAMVGATMTDEKIVRITEANGTAGKIAVNVKDPMRRHELEAKGIKVFGDIGQDDYDVKVVTKPISSTHRQMLEERYEKLLAKLPPELVAVSIDLFVEGLDFPNKRELAERFKNAAGGGQPNPEQQAQQQQAQQMQQQAGEAMMTAEVQTKQAGAAKAGADAQKAQVELQRAQIELEQGMGRSEMELRHAEDGHGQRMQHAEDGHGQKMQHAEQGFGQKMSGMAQKFEHAEQMGGQE